MMKNKHTTGLGTSCRRQSLATLKSRGHLPSILHSPPTHTLAKGVNRGALMPPALRQMSFVASAAMPTANDIIEKQMAQTQMASAIFRNYGQYLSGRRGPRITSLSMGGHKSGEWKIRATFPSCRRISISFLA